MASTTGTRSIRTPGIGPSNARFWMLHGLSQDIPQFTSVTVTPGQYLQLHDPQPQSLAPSGIASAESFGSASVAPDQIITPTGIASSEAFGTAALHGGAIIATTGIASGEAFGTALIGLSQIVAPVAIPFTEAIGSATVVVSMPLLVAPDSIDPGDMGWPDLSYNQFIEPEGFGGETFSDYETYVQPADPPYITIHPGAVFVA